MKTTVITIVSAVLSAFGAIAVTKWALPQESVNEIIAGVLSIVGGVFGVVAARHTPATAPVVTGDTK